MNNITTEDIKDIILKLVSTFNSKNTDYGNSFQKVREEYKDFPVILIRLEDKFRRLKTLLIKQERQQAVKDETVEDTLLDLANYAIMEVACMRKDKKP